MAFNEYYVRNTNGSDTSGQGTSHATAYQTVQFAIDDVATVHGARLGGNQDRMNLCDESSFVLASSPSINIYYTYLSQNLLWEGYSSVAGDDGLAVVDFNGGGLGWVSNHYHDYRRIHFTNNTGNFYLLNTAGVENHVEYCEFSESSYRGTDPECRYIERCYYHDIAGIGAYRPAHIRDCLFVNGVTNKFTAAIDTYSATVDRNFIWVDGASNGVDIGYYGTVGHNSILSAGGTGRGLQISGHTNQIDGNLVEGFSGVGGVGIRQGYDVNLYTSDNRGNAVYDCAAAYYDSGLYTHQRDYNNETLSASPFAKTGSLPTSFTSSTFWDDVYAYFASVDTGNVRAGHPAAWNLTKGAIQHAGGAASMLRRSNFRGGY